MTSDEPIFDKVIAEKRRQGWTYAQLRDATGLTVSQIRKRIKGYVWGDPRGPR